MEAAPRALPHGGSLRSLQRGQVLGTTERVIQRERHASRYQAVASRRTRELKPRRQRPHVDLKAPQARVETAKVEPAVAVRVDPDPVICIDAHARDTELVRSRMTVTVRVAVHAPDQGRLSQHRVFDQDQAVLGKLGDRHPADACYQVVG